MAQISLKEDRMKLISIIAGAALLTGCAGVGDSCYGKKNLWFTDGYCDGYRIRELPGRFERCHSEHLMNTTFNGLTCVHFSGRGLYAVSVDNKEADIATLQLGFDAEDEIFQKKVEAAQKKEKEEQERLKKALKNRGKCLAAFSKAIGIADDARQVLRGDLYFEAKSMVYVSTSQELINSELPDLSLSYPQLQSVAYRNSEEFTEWRQKTGQKCSQTLDYSLCMSANYVTELKDAEDEIIKNCKRR